MAEPIAGDPPIAEPLAPIISGDPPAADPEASPAAEVKYDDKGFELNADGTQKLVNGQPVAKPAEPEVKYDDKGFQVDKDGKQVLDKDGKPIPKPAEGPAEYTDFTIPDGLTLDAPSMAEFQTLAKEQGLTQEQAQKLLDFGGGKVKALVEAPYNVWRELQTKWQAEVKADPEIGGTNLVETQKNAALVFQPGPDNPFCKSADEAQALKEAFNTTGSGNHPAIVKLFSRLGALLKEPGSLTGNPVKQDAKALQDKMYDKM